MLSCASVYALWSPAGKGLASWLSIVMSSCEFSIGILGHVWYLIVSILDLCPLSYFYMLFTLSLDYVHWCSS